MAPPKGKSALTMKEGSVSPSAAPEPSGGAPWKWYDSAFRWPEKQYLQGPNNFEIWLQRVNLQMVAIGWNQSGDVFAEDDRRLAMHLSQVMEPGPWRYVNHLVKGMEMIERLKFVYRRYTSHAKVRAARELGRIKMRKLESVIDFRARFDDLVRQIEAAGGYRAEDELIDLYMQGVSDRFSWWVMVMRTMIRGNKFTLMDIQDSLFEEDRLRGNKPESPTRRANNSDSIIPGSAKSTKKKGVCWDCGKKGHYRGSSKCKKPKERNKSKGRDRSKARDRLKDRNRSKAQNRSKERGRSRGRSANHSSKAERQDAMPARSSESQDGYAYAISARAGPEAIEGYRNLCAELEAKRPNGDYPREDNLRGSRVQMRGRGVVKPPKCTPNRRCSSVCPDSCPMERDANVTKDVPEVVTAGEANFLYHSDRKEGRPKHHWLWDSGADCYIIGDPDWFTKSWVIPKGRQSLIRTGGGLVYPTKIDHVVISLKGPDNRPVRITLKAVLYINNFPLCIMSGELFYLGGGRLEGNTLVAKDGLPLHELDIPRRGFYLWLSKQREPLRRRAAAAHTAYEGVLEPSEEASVPA